MFKESWHKKGQALTMSANPEYYYQTLIWSARDLIENSTNQWYFHEDVWLGDESFEGKQTRAANTRIVNRVQRTAKNFSEPCHGCEAPAAMRWLSIRSFRPSSLPCDSRTNKSAEVFCFAKRLVKRAPRRNRWNDGARKKVNDRIDFIPWGKNPLSLHSGTH